MRRLALLALPLVLAACGGSSPKGRIVIHAVTTPSESATATVNHAIAKTAKQPVHASFSGLVTTSGQKVDMTGTGDVDPNARHGTMHVQMGLGGAQIPLDEVLDGSTAYVSSTFFDSFLPSGKKWLKVSLSSASNLGAAGFALTSQPGAVPPLKNVRKVGATEYTGEVDQTKLSPSEKDALKGAHVKFGKVFVWVGGDGYVHRVRVETSSSGREKAKIVFTTTMSNYGENVHVTVPPAAQTVNANAAGIPGFSS